MGLGVGDVGCENPLGLQEQLLQDMGLFLQNQTGVSLVKHSRQAQGIQGPCYMLHFSCEALNKKGSPWRGAFGLPLFAATFQSLLDRGCLGA